MSGRPDLTGHGPDLLAAARVVLVKPRFPENIGMAARACANMGIGGLNLVAPELWDTEHQEKALALATSQGEALLRGAGCFESLRAAVADCHFVLGSTARTGGWRRRVLSPTAAGGKIAERLTAGARIALVFGPEDRGLLNEEIELCTAIACIPTATGASSLNLAQAVLILTYECLKAVNELEIGQSRPDEFSEARGAAPSPNLINHAEQELLFTAMAKVLKIVDFLPQDNSDYFLLPLREFVHNRPLKRGEFSMLMGVCRQILGAVERVGATSRGNGPGEREP